MVQPIFRTFFKRIAQMSGVRIYPGSFPIDVGSDNSDNHLHRNQSDATSWKDRDSWVT